MAQSQTYCALDAALLGFVGAMAQRTNLYIYRYRPMVWQPARLFWVSYPRRPVCHVSQNTETPALWQAKIGDAFRTYNTLIVRTLNNNAPVIYTGALLRTDPCVALWLSAGWRLTPAEHRGQQRRTQGPILGTVGDSHQCPHGEPALRATDSPRLVRYGQCQSHMYVLVAAYLWRLNTVRTAI
jgi:hypothetical protein